uniref:Uncharacterized protein n=1 Tax=Meloidogyne enterolobii TaxID=390850 RepID=A0A6V7TP22_MELEN|nr:unnamed protein product [Meloidogyne enterolobii]
MNFISFSIFTLLIVLILYLNSAFSYTYISYHKPLNKEQQESERIQSIVSKCYQNSCRQWVLECHWFCDAIRGLKDYERCLDCLRTQGMGCYECFDL